MLHELVSSHIGNSISGDIIQMIWVVKSMRMMHVYLIVQLTMQESILDVDLMNESLTLDIIHLARFIHVFRTICLLFIFKQPYRSSNILPLGPQDKFPSLVRNKSIKFILSVNGPVRVTKCMKM